MRISGTAHNPTFRETEYFIDTEINPGQITLHLTADTPSGRIEHTVLVPPPPEEERVSKTIYLVNRIVGDAIRGERSQAFSEFVTLMAAFDPACTTVKIKDTATWRTKTLSLNVRGIWRDVYVYRGRVGED